MRRLRIFAFKVKRHEGCVDDLLATHVGHAGAADAAAESRRSASLSPRGRAARGLNARRDRARHERRTRRLREIELVRQTLHDQAAAQPGRKEEAGDITGKLENGYTDEEVREPCQDGRRPSGVPGPQLADREGGCEVLDKKMDDVDRPFALAQDSLEFV